MRNNILIAVESPTTNGIIFVDNDDYNRKPTKCGSSKRLPACLSIGERTGVLNTVSWPGGRREWWLKQ